MCREWPGPVAEYDRFGIVQLHLPHQDTLAPEYDALLRGCEFIREQRRTRPDKRVYVHCKGGIARASTMSLAHYVVNHGADPAARIEEMKAVRPMVMRGIVAYPALRRLAAESQTGRDG